MTEYIVSSFKTLTGSKSKDVIIYQIFDAIKKCVLEKQITAIRGACDKKVIENLKKNLPCITTSGTFKNSHKASDIIAHSGLIQIDIDKIPDRINELLQRFIKDPYTFACFISPRGNGIKLVVKIKPDPDTHLLSFLDLKNYYDIVYNVDIDNSCKDICRVMFLSADKDIFVNKDSKIFITTSVPVKTKVKPVVPQSALKNDFELLLEQIISNRINLTDNPKTRYQTWLHIGFALADEYKEAGRQYYHSISNINPIYDYDKTNKQYDECLKGRNSGITIKTLFGIAKDYGIIVSPSKKSLDVNFGDIHNYKSLPAKQKVVIPEPKKQPINEDVLTSPVNIELFIEENFHKNDFFISQNVYYTKYYNKNGKQIKDRLSNFLMDIIFHFNDGSNNTKRLLKLQHHSGAINLIEVQSSEASPERFETILKSHKCSFFGSGTLLKKIFAALMDHEIEALYLNQLGYNPLLNLFVFADSIIFEDNTVSKVNKHGILLRNDNYYYLPAFSYNNLNNAEYSDMRNFVFKPGNLFFKDYVSLMKKAFGLKAIIGISYLISSLFRDIIIKETGFFPFLFLFGPAGTGKSSFIEILTRLFGEHDAGCPIKGSTPKYIGRKSSQKKNSLLYLKEYNNNIDNEMINFFKNAYDGVAYGIANKSTDNKTTTFIVENGIIIDGNQLPTAEHAMFDRNIIIDFFLTEYTPDEVLAYQKLIDESSIGLGNVLLDILKHRDYFREQYRTSFRESLLSVKKDIIEIKEKTVKERILKHIAFLYTPIKILADKLEWGFTDSELDILIDKIYTDAIEKMGILHEISSVNIFWTAINFERNKDRTSISNNVHYKKDESEFILYLKIKEVYPFYMQYCKNNNIIPDDKSTLKKNLTNEPYFIPGEIKERGPAYTKFGFGSCYKFRYTKSENDHSIIIINNNELNL